MQRAALRRDAAGDPRGRAADAVEPASARRRPCRAWRPAGRSSRRRLSRLVRGELDWIVMKALAKERERRYASAVGLADDVERYLNHEPVSAGPPTAAYRLRKFVRRNRAQVVAAGLVLLALCLGVVGTTLGLFEARRQEKIAVHEAQAREEARKDEAEQRRIADEAASPGREAAGPGDEDERDPRLDLPRPGHQESEDRESPAGVGPGASVWTGRRRRSRGRRPATRWPWPGCRWTWAPRSWSLGYPARAMALFTKARATFAAELGPDHPDTLMSMNNLAVSYVDAGQNDRALKLHEETLALRKAKLGPDHPDTLSSMNNLADSYAAAGQNDRALKLREETLALRKAKLGPDHPDTLASMNNLADSYYTPARTTGR